MLRILQEIETQDEKWKRLNREKTQKIILLRV